MPIFGEQRREITVVMQIEMVQSGSEVLLRSEYCGSSVRTALPGLTMVFPDALVRSLVAGERHARLDLSKDSSLVSFEQDWYVEVRGAVLDDPRHDPLPTSIDDPRVVDQDGDGMPGITIAVDLLGLISAEVYAVQRVRYRLVGWVEEDGGAVFGRIEWADEQVVLDASSPLLAAGSPGTPVWEESSFRIERTVGRHDCGD